MYIFVSLIVSRVQVEVHVHDSTADLRILAVPQRPIGTDGWTEEMLRTLVTRDSMIGVARAREPSPLYESPPPLAPV